ncbi:SDR family oxidoreductase [Streptomyces sp. H10-C2]|uniref:SDR family NAD(P)-dependent oxidoreductase n=1 Tax=unclassified Streptomyces TaxID=2593676 RepID=UPI0024BA2B5E|nr:MULTISPECIES: SDR family oxidoreductase [unclassified Streptomyces]MDJ0341872.1 SDR family oxidoreductase [Streptomyces sp. PH10-H1]MDJ0370374.1 SDR family oxidoreductase [Streptomyces sp. H10-C2]
MTLDNDNTVDENTAGRPASSWDLRGKRILVTGGSRGIGRGIVLAAARAGAQVITCYRQPGEAVTTLEAELAATGGKHLVVRADATKEADIAELADTVEARVGGLDAVVNNAGTYVPTPYADLDAAQWAATVDGNLTAAHLVIHRSLGLLAPGASIVNIGSTVAFIGIDGGVHYTAVKAALVGMGRSLARELGSRGIRVNTLSPGRIETEAMDDLPPQVAAFQRKMFSSFTALGRLGTVEEIAGAVLFLVSDLSTYITGQNIHVDGCV